MRETGFVNRDVSDVISMMGHMDEMIVCDAGFPIPLGVRTVDISLAKDRPTVLELLEELIKHFSVEKLVMANETKNVSPTRFNAIVDLFPKSIPVETIAHTDLKHRSAKVKGVIRTGDFTAYSNVLLVSGAGDRWYLEK
ncbi:MAG TPA: D-ribose pyranase [Sedimentisphaerales bacterium]|nr:D-ribose pyranase [Sedimentisphaerales bacterium]